MCARGYRLKKYNQSWCSGTASFASRRGATVFALVAILVTRVGRSADALRAATVADGIQMAGLASPAIAEGLSPCEAVWGGASTVASISPDGKALVVVLRRGDANTNLLQYTMLLWQTDDLRSGRPKVVLRMNSSSLRSAIDPDTISWAADSHALTFLGEHAGQRHQLFELNIETGKLDVLAAGSVGNIISYGRSASGTELAYEVGLPQEKSLWNAYTARHGLAVTWQSLSDVETGQAMWHTWPQAKLFVKGVHGIEEVQPPKGSFFPYSVRESDSDRGISVSPDGRYIVLLATVPVGQLPSAWRRYREPFVRAIFKYLQSLSLVGRYQADRESFDQGDLERYVVVDLRTGRSRVLLNSPVTWLLSDPPVWSPDSRHVVLSDVLMPIQANVKSRPSGRMTLEVNVPTGEMTQVDQKCEVARSWTGGTLTCSATQSWIRRAISASDSSHALENGGFSDHCAAPVQIQFLRNHGGWLRAGRAEPASPAVFIKESLNVPPKLYFRIRGKQPRMLWDPNPQLDGIRLAREELMSWEWSKGHSMTGGLYYPANYRPGRRYPLVIQTHGFNRNTFSYFGEFSTAFAAQPLAARNMFVLQIDDMDEGLAARGPHWQLDEVKRAMQVYRSGIEYLTHRGLVDKSKVGIIGFSHTCFFVDWALTHDPQLFAAGSVSEGEDGSYLEYMVDAMSSVEVSSLYSGPPFGRNLQSWVALAPVFHLDGMRAPLWIGVDHNSLAYSEWEWFGGLRHLGKPVYMVVLDGRSEDGHLLVKPWDRLISSGGNVDWFDFWLNGHEDSDPAKARQYAQWRRLRASAQRGPRSTISWR